ncbi:MAG: hypothetical protein KDI19_11235 [Pseudomonadales bacterium]|nr:hypothetical protein [Pseudomonadales bacterium]
MKLERLGPNDLVDTVAALPIGISLLRVEPGNRFVLEMSNDIVHGLLQSDPASTGQNLTLLELKFTSPDLLARLQENAEQVVSTRTAATFEYPTALQDHRVRWISYTMVPLKEYDKVVRLLVTIKDNTALVEARRRKSRDLARIASSFLRICAWCSSVVDDEKGWLPVQEYVKRHPVHRPHAGRCPACASAEAPAT